MSNNFQGNVRKNANSFKPQTRASDGAGVGRAVAGVWPGQDAPVVFEKANDPVLPTDPSPRTDGLGEREMGLSGSVDHPNADGGAKYLASRIAREYRRIVADGASLETLSTEERRALVDRLSSAVIDGGNQEPNHAVSAGSAIAYVRQVAALLFGLIDELPGTPDFLRAPKLPTSDDNRVGRFGSDYLQLKSETGFVHKSANRVEVECPFCHKGTHIEHNIGNEPITGLQKLTCGSCGRGWQQDVSISTFTKSADPTLAELKKRLGELTENIRTILARRAGQLAIESTGSSGRFVTKDAGNGADPKRLLKTALDNGTPVPFSGADPRSAADRASGSGRKFETRRS